MFSLYSVAEHLSRRQVDAEVRIISHSYLIVMDGDHELRCGHCAVWAVCADEDVQGFISFTDTVVDDFKLNSMSECSAVEDIVASNSNIILAICRK